MMYDCAVIVVSARHPLGPTSSALFLATMSLFFLAARCAERLPYENKELENNQNIKTWKIQEKLREQPTHDRARQHKSVAAFHSRVQSLQMGKTKSKKIQQKRHLIFACLHSRSLREKHEFSFEKNWCAIGYIAAEITVTAFENLAGELKRDCRRRI